MKLQLEQANNDFENFASQHYHETVAGKSNFNNVVENFASQPGNETEV